MYVWIERGAVRIKLMEVYVLVKTPKDWSWFV